MAYRVEWLDSQQKILRTVYLAGWTWQEFVSESAATELTYLDSVNHQVIMLQVFEGNVPLFPTGWAEAIEGSGTTRHANFKGAVLVSSNRLAKILFSIFNVSVPHHKRSLHLVKSEDEALPIVEHLVHN